MRVSRLLAVSIATGLLSGGLFGYPQFVDAGWSHDASLWLAVIGFLGPGLLVAGLALASRAVSQRLGMRRDSTPPLDAPSRNPTSGRPSRAA